MPSIHEMSTSLPTGMPDTLRFSQHCGVAHSVTTVCNATEDLVSGSKRSLLKEAFTDMRLRYLQLRPIGKASRKALH